MWFKANSTNLPEATCCLQVRIPSHDRKLKHTVPWMRKRLPFLDEEDALLVAKDWLYFGVVAPAVCGCTSICLPVWVTTT
jgi:hypothetical protein